MMLSTKRVVVLCGLLAAVLFFKSAKILSVVDYETTAREQVLDSFRQPGEVSATKNSTPSSGLPINRLTHVTIFGLGHRLCRTTAAWHLAQRLNLTHMRFRWGSCGPTPDTGPAIFPFLFGQEDWEVPSSSYSQRRGKQVLVRNDVYGYVPGHALQTFQKRLTPNYKNSEGPFLQKLQSDAGFYQLMRKRYQFKDEVHQFMQQHRFDEHTVIGLHLRAGNGEQTHFAETSRYIANETEFVSNLMEMMAHFVGSSKQYQIKPPLIFLATDTPYLVSGIRRATQAFGVPTVVLPQIRVEDNVGVTFKVLKGAGDKCLQGWQAMFSDMLLLSYADVLVAARHSSFTQSLPLSLIFNRTKEQPGPRFCEVSSNATSMACWGNLKSWLFRDDISRMWTHTIRDTSTEPVYHKLVIHLPDPEPVKEYEHVASFLQGEDPSVLEIHTYGNKRFNPKYRNAKPVNQVRSWNFA